MFYFKKIPQSLSISKAKSDNYVRMKIGIRLGMYFKKGPTIKQNSKRVHNIGM